MHSTRPGTWIAPLVTALLALGACGDAPAPRSRQQPDSVLPPGVEMKRDPRHGVVRWLEGPDLDASLARDPAYVERRRNGDAAGIAARFVEVHRSLFRLDDPGRELRVRARERDALGMSHVRFEQVHHGLPVWGAELTVHLDAALHVVSVNGSTIPTPASVPATATVPPARAREIAAAAVGAAVARAGDAPPLIVWVDERGTPRLAYDVPVVRSLIDRQACVVDAITGDVLATRSTLQTGR